MSEVGPKLYSRERNIYQATYRILEVMSAIQNITQEAEQICEHLRQYAKEEKDELTQDVLLLLSGAYQTIADSAQMGQSADFSQIIAFILHSSEVSKNSKDVLVGYLKDNGTIKIK